jgi:hypothetical protein
VKKILLIIISLILVWTVFSSDIIAADPTPKIEPVPVNNKPCPNNGTVYPPNSDCYSETKVVERVGINLVDSNEGFLSYPLTCISAPSVTYKEIYTGQNPPTGSELTKTVSVFTDISEAQLGFLGPDSITLATSNPDTLAKKYLFSALFDRPGTNPNVEKESFRTFWRMLDSLSQAQLKAFFLENTNNHTYFYVGSDYMQHDVSIETLKSVLPSCLKKYSDDTCWQNSKYVDDYLSLGQKERDEYDALLPFDFNNMRGYISSGTDVSKENIPYLQAIISGLKGYRNNTIGFPNTIIPGLFDYYTPEWTRRNLALYPTIQIQDEEKLLSLQYPIIKFIASLTNSCDTPANSSSLPSPKTYPNNPNTSQNLTFTVTPTLISSTPDECVCDPENTYCYDIRHRFNPNFCSEYNDSETSCLEWGCIFIPGEDTYELTGSADGHPITVFNNPYITSLTDLVVGGKQLIPNISDSKIIDFINQISDKLISPVQPSFYSMLLPDFASESASPKSFVSAQTVNTTATTANTTATVTVSGSNTIYRENNLAQDTMHLMQNCWLVPSDQQSSSKCGSKEIVGTCDGTKLKKILGDSVTPPSPAANSYFYSYILPGLTPEVISAYAAAEKATGVPCEVLAGIHFEEGGNEPSRSLQDGRPLSGVTLEESAIKAGEELNGKAGGSISDIDTLISALSRYNGGGNSNCQPSGSCPAAASLTRCGNTVACATTASACISAPTPQPGSCRATCGSGSFPWPITYNYCSPHPKEGYDDPYATDMWQSPQNDTMYLLFQYDYTQTIPIPHGRPGALTVALSLYLTNNPNP